LSSGKSTLLNRLTDAGILAEDKLFATLDPTTRKLELPSGNEVLLTDTVGFIRNLPHHLVEAFKSTLEEVAFSDVIMIVCDASDPECASQLEVTETLIADIMEKSGAETPKKTDSYAEDIAAMRGKSEKSGFAANGADLAEIGGKPVIYVYNKCDCESSYAPMLKDTAPENRVFISAKTGEGIDNLLSRIEEIVMAGSRRVTFRIPNTKQGVMNILYKNAAVEDVDYGSEYVTVTAVADEKVCGQLSMYIQS